MEKKMESQLGLIEQSFNESYSLWAREALDELPENFTITDPCISGHPIVFASRGFLKMTGYLSSEVVGKNGRMFQGPATSRRSVMEVREAVREERAIQITLLNYRKDGTPFWMLFHMCPVFSKQDGRVINFVAVQVPISRKLRLWSGFVCGGNGANGVDCSSEEINDFVYGSCRREVCSDSVLKLGRVLALDSDVGELEIEEPCEASDVEKRRAASAINNVLSVLTHNSESTGRRVWKEMQLIWGGPSKFILDYFSWIDPHTPDMPIVYASDAFLTLTGYTRNEVLGRNCRFLNGAETDSSTTHQMEESIRTEQACTVRILSYRKDKSSFWNLLHISPVRNATGKIAYLVGVHVEEGCANQDGHRHGLSPEMRQLSTVGAVKVAVRGSSMAAGPSKP